MTRVQLQRVYVGMRRKKILSTLSFSDMLKSKTSFFLMALNYKKKQNTFSKVFIKCYINYHIYFL